MTVSLPIMLNSEKYPKLRTDLVVKRRVFSGDVFYVFKDPVRLEYFSIDEVAYDILVLCNGRNDLQRILEKFNQKHPGADLEMEMLVAFIDGYRKSRFFEDAYEMNVLLLEKMRKSRADIIRRAKQNMLEIDFPAWNPDEFFNRVVPKIGFFFTKKALVVYGLIVLFAAGLAFSNPERLVFKEPLYEFGPHPLVGMLILWAVLLFSVVLHELGHGTTCKHFGGSVYRIGFLLLYFNPCLYCDTTESYFFEKKAHKHAVTLAGGVVDLMVASTAVVIWYVTTDDLFISQLCHRIMLLCGVTGIIFNLNPLLKYDGYFLLSNQLDLPNLREGSFKFLGDNLKKSLGLPYDEEPLPPTRKKIFAVYGVLALIYSVFVLGFVALYMGSLLIAAFGRLGYVATGALIFGLTWGYAKKVGGFVRFVFLEKRLSLKRRAPRILLIVLALIAFFLFVPFRHYVRGEVLVQPAHTGVVRAEMEGTLTRFHALQGQWVEGGAVLGMIDSEEVRSHRARSEFDLEIALAKSAAAEARGDASESRQAGIDAELAREAVEYYRDLEENSTLRSPVSGRVLTPYLLEKVGSYFEEGDTVCIVADLDRMRVEMLVDERDLHKVEIGAKLGIRFRSKASRTVSAWVEEISPEAVDGVSPRSFRLLAKVDNADGWIRPGMTGEGRVYVGWRSLARKTLETLQRWTRIDFWI